MYYNDHPPPHFHVRYNQQKAIIDIETLSILEGKLSPRILGLVVEWAALHQTELMQNWQLARLQTPLEPIAPLEETMLKDISSVQPLKNYQLHIKFEDNQEGVVDISQLIEFTGIFAPLQDLTYFNQVKLNPEWGTIYWENGADLDPDVLYSIVTNQPIQIKETITNLM